MQINDYFRSRMNLYFLLFVILGAILLPTDGRTEIATPVGPPMKPSVDLISSDSRWLYKESTQDTVLVFVHGIFGDTVGTWTNGTGKTFFQYVKESPIGPKVDMFAFGFTSTAKSGSANIVEAANTLSAKLELLGVMSYKNVVLVTHSMGGLVAMRALVSNPELRARVPLVVFYATPQEGAHIANIGAIFLSNPALTDMQWADRNTFLQALLQDWGSLSPKPKVSCGYETLKTGLSMVVPWTSSTRICIDAPPPAPISGADHLTIVKPDRPQHDSLVMLINAVNRFVLADPKARLATPDFKQEGNHYVYTLSGASGYALIMNESRAKTYYYIKDISDESLYIVPEEMPQSLGAFESRKLRINLLRYSNLSEYSFVIRSDSGEEKKVLVKVKPKAVAAEQERTMQGYLDWLSAHLSQPTVSARLVKLSIDNQEAQHEAAQVAYDYLSRENPDLPAGALWVLAADTLSSVQFSTAAVFALQQAEAASPKSASTPAVQKLASKVAAQAGQPIIFKHASTPLLAPSDKGTTFGMFRGSSPSDSYQLSKQLQAIPALRAQGLQIEGDLRLSNGDREGALGAYLEAASTEKSPATDIRIQALDPAKGFDWENFKTQDSKFFQIEQKKTKGKSRQ